MDFAPEDIESFAKLSNNIKDLNSKIERTKARVEVLSSEFASATDSLRGLMIADSKLSQAKLSQIGYVNLVSAAAKSQAAAIQANAAATNSATELQKQSELAAKKKEAMQVGMLDPIRTRIAELQASKEKAEPGTKGAIKREIKDLRQQEASVMASMASEAALLEKELQTATESHKQLVEDAKNLSTTYTNNEEATKSYTDYLNKLAGAAKAQVDASNRTTASLLGRVERESAVSTKRANVDDRSETMVLIDNERDALQSSVAELEGQIANFGDITTLSGEQKTAAESLLNGLNESKNRLKENANILDGAYKEAAKTNLQNLQAQAIQMDEQINAKREADAKKQAEQIERENERKSKALTSLLGTIAGVLDRFANTIAAFDKLLRDNMKQLGTSYGSSLRIISERFVTSIKSMFSKNVFLPTEDIKKMQESFGSAFGGILSTSAAGAFMTAAKMLNIAPEQYVAALRPLAGITGSIGKAQDKLKTIASTFIASGLKGNDAAKFIAENSEILARNGDRFAAGLTRAAIEAQKAGYSLQGIEGFGDRLVSDFEGTLTDFTALAAMGIDFDIQKLTEASLSGNTEDLKNALQSEFQRLNIDPNNMNRAVRIQLETAMKQPLSEILKIQKAPETARSVTQVLDKAAVQGPTPGEIMFEKAVVFFDKTVKTLAFILGAYVTLRGARSFAEKAGEFGFGKGREPLGGPQGTPRTPGGGPSPVPGGTATPQTPSGNTGGMGSTASQVSRFSMNDVLKGAAAMLIVAASLYVLGKALQEYKGVEWEQLAMAGAGLAGLTAGVFALSKIPTANLIKGALAMAIVSGSVLLLGTALKSFSGVKWEQLGMAGAALLGIGVGLGVVGALMTGPQIIGVLGFAAALGLVSLALMGIAKAFEIASPGFIPFGKMLESFGNTIKTVFTGLGDIITSIGDAIAKVVGTTYDSVSKLVDTLSKANVGNILLIGPALVSAAGGITALAAATMVQGFANLGSGLLDKLGSALGIAPKPPATATLATPTAAPTTSSTPGGTTATDAATNINTNQAAITENLARLINTLNVTNQRMNEVANRLNNISFDVNLDGNKVGTGTMRARNVAAVNGASR